MDRVLAGTAASDRRAVEVLCTNGWLSMVDQDFRHALLKTAKVRQIPQGQSVSYAGDEQGSAWGVIVGQVDFTSGVSSINTPIAEIALPGEWWGFRPLQTGPRAVHAVARTDLIVAEIGLGQLAAMLNDVPVWWRHIALINGIKQERWGSGMVDLTIKNSRLRCIAVLLRLAGCRHAVAGTRPVTIHFTQDQLAAAANLSRYPAGTILRELARSGLIKLGYGTIELVQPAQMRAMIDEA